MMCIDCKNFNNCYCMLFDVFVKEYYYCYYYKNDKTFIL